MADIFIAVGIGIFTAAIAVMGVYVTLKPPLNDGEKRKWLVAFIAVAIATCLLIAWQTARGVKAQNDLQGQLTQIQSQFNKIKTPPTAEENAAAVVRLEKQQQQATASNNQAESLSNLIRIRSLLPSLPLRLKSPI